MTRFILTLTLLFCLAHHTSAQSNPLDKKLERAIEMAQNGKLDKAETYLNDLLEDHPDYAEGWELLIKINYRQYEQSKASDNLLGGNITVTTKDKNGKVIESNNDSLAQNLMSMLQEIKPSKRAFSKFVYNCRRATAQCNETLYPSVYLRNFFVDVDVDSNVNRKALKYFNDAEKEFQEKNYTKAAALYKRAIESQPDFYKAQMYLGDCFYAMGNYPDAIESFKEAKTKFPDLLEPCKYLTDAYGKANLYDKSIEEAIRSMTIYPDNSMNRKLEDALYLNHQRITVNWIPRAVLPNKMEDTGTRHLNEYTPEKPMKATGPWNYYAAAKDKIAPYCNAEGIITKSNKLTTARYMEVYSWEQMLKNSKDTSLANARRMQAAGYLDCYVMTTCFHHDFYEQYLDFVRENADRIKKYYHDQIKYQ